MHHTNMQGHNHHITLWVSLLRGRQRKSSGAQLATKSGDKSSKWKQQSAQLRLAMKASQGDSLAVAALTAQAHNVRPNPGKQDTTVPCYLKCSFAAHMLDVARTCMTMTETVHSCRH